ncbi:unnamed protein product, partial [marine sediment metagenome]
WKKMIENEELDVISICTPNYLHALTVLKAIDKNSHILCEKPIAISQKERYNYPRCSYLYKRYYNLFH